MMRTGLPRNLANFLAFQATWWSCALGAAVGCPWLGPMVAILWLSVHFATLEAQPSATQARLVELRLLLAAALIGYLLDSLMVLTGVLSFPTEAGPALPITLWMVVLWTAFAATLRHSLNWARQRYLLGMLAGAVFGPLAYRAGDLIGAITLAPGPLGLFAIAIEWLIAAPLLLWLRERIEQRT